MTLLLLLTILVDYKLPRAGTGVDASLGGVGAVLFKGWSKSGPKLDD